MIRLVVNGATGRMGRRVLSLSAADPARRTSVVAGIARRGEPEIGGEIDGVPIVDSLEKAAALVAPAGEGRVVIVDFSSAEGLSAAAKAAAGRGMALVSGTTGLSEIDQAGLRAAAAAVPVVWAPNMSLGVHLVEKLVALAARALGESADIEIVEAHHRHKVDAPSGTARRLAEIAGAERPGSTIRSGRTGVSGERPRPEIGIQSIRMGEVVGDHAVHFALDHEVITVSHRALSRDVFAAGALAAARFAAGAEPGLYAMEQVLGI